MTVQSKLEPGALLLPLAALAPVLIATSFIAANPGFDSTLAVHWIMQVISGVMLGFCAIAVYRGTAIRLENSRYLIVAGLGAAAVLDICHGLLLISELRPEAMDKLIPWGWLPSRVILPIMLLLSIHVESLEKRTEQPMTLLVRASVLITALYTLACCITMAFYADLLPQIYYQDRTVHRPSEIVPAGLFFLALLSLLRRGRWRRDVYEYNLLLAVVVAVVAHTLFMPFAQENFNNVFAAAVTTKMFGYVLLVAAIILQSRDTMRAETISERLRHQAIVETASDAIITFDAHGTIDSFNPAATRLYGRSAEEAIGQDITLLTPHTLRAPHAKYLKYVRSGKAPSTNAYSYEAVGLRKDGSTFPAESAINEVQIGGERLFTAIIRDITERKAEQARLEELSDRLTLALDSAQLGMWEQNLDTGKLTWNRQMFSLYDRDPALGEPSQLEWVDLTVPEDRDACFEAHTAAAEHGALIDMVYRIRLPGGEIRWIRANGKLVERDKDHPLRLVGINQDISDNIQYLEELKAARKQADDANRAKTTFLATMSHEIRTPLNGVIGLNEVLQQTSLDGHQHELTGLIQQSANALLEIIDDVLDLSKIEAGKLELDPVPLSPGQIVDEVCSMLANQGTSAGVDLHTNVAPDMPAEVRGDAKRLRQILLNLANNAIKFSSRLDRRGSVSINARVSGGPAIPEEGGSSQVQLLFEVVDNGLGMTRETVDRLFSPFTQADASISRKFGGTGLGLTISQRLAGLMGGDIRVSSELNKGSRFTVSLPFEILDPGSLSRSAGASQLPLTNDSDAIGQGREAPSREVAIKENKLVLVAEDNPTNQQVILQQLSVLGFHADVTENGARALEAWRSGSYALLLTDLQMPEIDGYALARQVRTLEGANERIPIIALSANTLMDEADACLAAGMDAYLSKPVSLAELEKTLTAWLPTQAGDHEHCSPAAT